MYIFGRPRVKIRVGVQKMVGIGEKMPLPLLRAPRALSVRSFLPVRERLF